MIRILEELFGPKNKFMEELKRDCGFSIPWKKFLKEAEQELHQNILFHPRSKEGLFLNQIIRDYNEFRKSGKKPTHFGGA